jgi:tetratricopeptide (TPR) repeat protein
MDVVVLALALLVPQDPAEQLRRQELGLRLEEHASAGRFEAVAKAVFRELRGRKIDGSGFDLCWKIVALRRWNGKLEEFVAAWDKAAVSEPPAPGIALFRARLESIVSKPKVYRELIEGTAKRFPGEPAVLWYVGLARFEAGEHAAAASALEELGPLQGFSYDLDEYHKMLARSYGETGRSAPAVEHLRAVSGELESVDRAVLALKCRLPREAAQCYRMAIADGDDRISIRLGLIQALQTGGEEKEAAAERRKMFVVDGKVNAARVEDYFFLLPPSGRAEEIRRTMRELLAADVAVADIALKVPADERGAMATAWEKAAADERDWLILAQFRRAWGGKDEQIVDVLDKGEKLHPTDPRFPRERIEPLVRLGKFPEAAAAYEKLLELDPEGKRTGPRPHASLQAAVAGLVAKKDLATALRLGVRALSEPGLDDAARTATRIAMKPACETSGTEFWAEVRKLKLPAPDAKVELLVKARISKLSDDEFAVRSEAGRELQKVGLPAIPLLLQRIDDDDAEVRSKTREIIRAILSE